MHTLLPQTAYLTYPISILLVDNCPTFRQGLKNLLEFHSLASPLQFQIVGQAASLQQAIDLAIQQSPMLILLDVKLCQKDELDELHMLCSHTPASKVLVISTDEEEEWVFQAMQAGAKGVVFKHHVSSQLLTAIEVVMQNQIYLSPEAATQFFRLFHFCGGRSMIGNQAIHLTRREREVLYWLVQGASNEAISQELHITVGTVKAYLTTIFEKLNVNSRTQAALQALKLGLVPA